MSAGWSDQETEPPPRHGRVAMISVHTSPARPARHRRRGRHERLRHRARAAPRRPAASRSRSSPGPPRPRLPPVVEAGRRRARPPRRTPARSRASPRASCPASCAPSPARCCAPRPRTSPGYYDVVHSPLLALRPGRRAGPRPLGRPARALDAHHGQGQERRARRGRHPRAGRPGDRRGAGRRGRRPAGRQHRHRGPASWSTCTTPTRRASRSSTPASTSTSSARAAGAARARLGLPRRRGRAAVRRPDPAAQGARRAAARGRACCSSATRRCARGSSYPSSAARPAPASSTPSRSPSWPPTLGIDDVVRFVPPVGQAELADWYARRDRWSCVPSYNESFGLVAVEAQACGTPVVAAAVGGLTHRRARRASRAARRRPRPGDYAARCDRLIADAGAARASWRAGRSRTRRRSAGSAPPSGRSTVYDAAPAVDARATLA